MVADGGLVGIWLGWGRRRAGARRSQGAGGFGSFAAWGGLGGPSLAFRVLLAVGGFDVATNGDTARLEAHATPRPVLFHFDGMTHHPEFDLFQAGLPAALEFLHPLAAADGIGYVCNQPHQIVPVQNTTTTLVPFELLCLVAGGAEVGDDLQDRFPQPLGRHVSPVIEPQGEQHLESPPLAAHTLSFP